MSTTTTTAQFSTHKFSSRFLRNTVPSLTAGRKLTLRCAKFPQEQRQSRRLISISVVLLHCLSIPNNAMAGSGSPFDKYVKRKKLEPLEAYIPAIILTEMQIKESGKTLEADKPAFAACRSLLRAGPAASLCLNIRAVADANEVDDSKTASNDVDQCLRLTNKFAVNSFLNYPRSCKCNYDAQPKEMKRDSFYIDKQGKLKHFNHKKVSRKKGTHKCFRAIFCSKQRVHNSLQSSKGQGWKYGSGFVDGIFPVLSPDAHQILNFMKREMDVNKVWDALSSLPPTHTTWDDIISVAVQLRLNKRWDSIVSICEWILYRSTFQPDVICYNLLIDAFGQKSCPDKAESTYLNLLEARCIPTEDTYALLLRAYCTCGLLEKAEAVFMEMQKHGRSPSAVVYNAYIDGLVKGRNSQKAIEIFQRMKRNCCQPSIDTYTMLINMYGKANRSYMALKVFQEMRSQKCKPNICTYTALINAFAREGLCEKAEEIFEELQEAGIEPDVYAYNALMESYSRAGFPYGAAEIFSLMQHMGCEPDRASFNIMVDAYGRSGLHEDAQLVFEEMKRLGIEPTMKSHMVLLSAYSKAGIVSKCEEIVSRMHKSGVEPDTFVLNTMLNVYGRMGHFKKMEQVLTVMENRSYSVSPDISTYNILINMYGRAGYFEQMEEIFRLLPTKNLQRDVVTWTSRLAAYSRKKQYTRCLEIFEEMITEGCYPDGGTARVLLSACSTKEQVEQVSLVLRTMHKDMKTEQKNFDIYKSRFEKE